MGLWRGKNKKPCVLTPFEGFDPLYRDDVSLTFHTFALFRKLESNGVSATTGNEKIDKLMKDAIIVLRTHLIELQKVASLAEDFHTKYLQALRKRVSHDVLVGSTGDSDDDLAEPGRPDEVRNFVL
ncbi:hypothetical protein Aduo_019217 [Ancylostoma duodenale]